MKRVIHTTLFCLLFLGFIQAQYDDYLGAGHNGGISISSSSNFESSNGSKTIDGNGMQAPLMEYSRFLSQTTFGSDMEEIERAQNMGMEAWLEEQFNMPINYYTPQMWESWGIIEQTHFNAAWVELAYYIMYQCEAAANDPNIPEPEPLTDQEVEDYIEYYKNDLFGPYAAHFNYTFSENLIKAEDQLRQRMAFALSQIFVVSSQSDLGDNALSLTSYYDILLHQSFGNYKDLLLEVTLSPSMGFYLSHLNNSKAIPEENIHPDENYAREIMQLFSIGLYELNQDGTRKKDTDGNDIPTYNNADIKEMARVFTGLGPGELDPDMDIWWTDEAYFGLGLYGMSKSDPLIMYEEYHDQDSKSLMNGLDIPAGQGGMADIEMAVDFLFNHPNTGPFISRQLIQRFIKSNPSPEYISRVSAIFADNGMGERGDLQAVLKAIILDDEARTCEEQQFLDAGKLNEPVLRSSRLLRNVDYFGIKYNYDIDFGDYSCAQVSINDDSQEIITENLNFWNNGFDDNNAIKQYPLMAPTVFNFFTPDHSPVGEMTSLDLVGPEYKIHDTSTAINYINQVHMFANPWYNVPWYNWHTAQGIPDLMLDYKRYDDLVKEDPEKLLNYLDIVLLQGNMSDNLRNTLRTFIKDLPDWIVSQENQIRAKQLIYLIMISPDYTIAK